MEPTGELEDVEERSARRRSERRRRRARARASEVAAITGGRRRRTREGVRRLPALLVLVAGLVAVGLVEREGDTDRVGATAAAEQDDGVVGGSAAPAALAPVSTASGALGASWFCAGGTSADGDAAHTVVVVNTGDQALTATVTAFPGAVDSDDEGQEAVADTEPVDIEVEVGALEVEEVALADVLDTPYVSALVELRGGAGVVEHRVEGDEVLSATPCATGPSRTWFLASGDTTRGASERIVLFNPFRDDAVVDLRFATTEGVRAPQQYSGLIVPGQQTVVLEVGAVVTRVPEAAATITTRTGQVVVDRLQGYDGTAGAEGLDLAPAAPGAALVWSFPDGAVREGTTQAVHVYNPTEQTAEVDVEISLDDPDDNGVVEPFALTIPPGAFARVDVDDEDRVPVDVGHSIVVRSQNDVPVVAERWTRYDGSAGRAGLSTTLGSPLVAPTWYLAEGATSDERIQGLIVLNPSTADEITFRVERLGDGELEPVDELTDVTVAPGARIPTNLTTLLEADPLPLVVTATGPVVVERGIYPVDALGAGRAVAIPAADGAAVRTPEG